LRDIPKSDPVAAALRYLAKAIISGTSVEISGGRLAHASDSWLRQQPFGTMNRLALQ
jgi:hypothetical protein